MNYPQNASNAADSSLSLSISELEQLRVVAKLSARCLRPPCVVYLDGPLGAGKTTFVRELAAALGYGGRVKSPTYGLLETYRLDDMDLLHLDLYRIENPEELEYLSLRDLFGSSTVLLIEWPRRGEGELPPADMAFYFSESEGERALEIKGCGERGLRFVAEVSERFHTSNLDDNAI